MPTVIRRWRCPRNRRRIDALVDTGAGRIVVPWSGEAHGPSMSSVTDRGGLAWKAGRHGRVGPLRGVAVGVARMNSIGSQSPGDPYQHARTAAPSESVSRPPTAIALTDLSWSEPGGTMPNRPKKYLMSKCSQSTAGGCDTIGGAGGGGVTESYPGAVAAGCASAESTKSSTSVTRPDGFEVAPTPTNPSRRSRMFALCSWARQVGGDDGDWVAAHGDVLGSYPPVRRADRSKQVAEIRIPLKRGGIRERGGPSPSDVSAASSYPEDGQPRSCPCTIDPATRFASKVLSTTESTVL